MIYRFFSLEFDDRTSIAPIDSIESVKFLLHNFVNLTNETRPL